MSEYQNCIIQEIPTIDVWLSYSSEEKNEFMSKATSAEKRAIFQMEFRLFQGIEGRSIIGEFMYYYDYLLTSPIPSE